MVRLRRRPALAAAVAVFALATVGLSATRPAPVLPLSRSAAIHDALGHHWVRHALRRSRWDGVVVDAIDSRLERVAFYHGGQVLAQVALRRDGSVAQAVNFRRLGVPYGDWIAFDPALLIVLGAVFVLMAGVAPWRRMRNLDVLAELTLLAPLILLQHRYVDASVLAALPALLYLLGRCVVRAFGSESVAAPSTPLIDAITPGWEPRRRVRLLRILLVALALAFVMVTVSSVDAVDVVYAVMEGATKLLDGVLPYGHMPGDIIHSDTYPLLSYALYVPVAWLSPVNSVWDSVDLALAVTVAAAAAVAWAIFRANSGSPGVRPASGATDGEAAGLRAALVWLAFPPVIVIASSGTSDVLLAAMLAFALLLWRRPGASTGLLAAAAWFKLAPLALLPVRLAPLRGRSLVRALLAIVLVTLPMLGLLLALGGGAGVMDMVHAIGYQFSRGSPQSLWSALGIMSLQPLGEAASLALIAAAVTRFWRHPELAEDSGRMAALAAAVMLALQLAANYWAFLYLVWVVPLLGLSLLAEPVRGTAPSPAPGRPPLSREPRPASAVA